MYKNIRVWSDDEMNINMLQCTKMQVKLFQSWQNRSELSMS